MPKFVGNAIGESEINALTALHILEQRGITHQHFGLYCGKTDVPMGAYDNLQDIPVALDCEVCESTRNLKKIARWRSTTPSTVQAGPIYA